LVFTDDKAELLKAVSRPDDPLSATQLALEEARFQAQPIRENEKNLKSSGVLRCLMSS
jgi:hypothetical protein